MIMDFHLSYDYHTHASCPGLAVSLYYHTIQYVLYSSSSITVGITHLQHIEDVLYLPYNIPYNVMFLVFYPC
jgi:hypothetical protein